MPVKDIDISEIRNKLKKGDIQTIADATGYAADTVQKVFSGVRNVTDENKKIIEAAEMWISMRDSLSTLFQKPKNASQTA